MARVASGQTAGPAAYDSGDDVDDDGPMDTFANRDNLDQCAAFLQSSLKSA